MRSFRHLSRKAPDTPAPAGKLIGYARVSTDDQNLSMQTAALEAVGCARIYSDKMSGVARKRPGLALALLDLDPGDTLVVWRLDRLGRSVLDLLTRIKALNENGVKFRSLTESIDTSTIVGNLLLAVLGAVAQFERDLTVERTKAGMARRKALGGKIGATPKMDFAGAAEMFRAGKTVDDVVAAYRLKSRSTVYHRFDKHTVSKLQAAGRRARKRKAR